MDKEKLREEFRKEFGFYDSENISYFWLSKMEAQVKEIGEKRISEMGFKDLVYIANTLLKNAYPLDIFDGSSSDIGPRFTAKLHEALDILQINDKEQ